MNLRQLLKRESNTNLVAISQDELTAYGITVQNAALLQELLDGRCLDIEDERARSVATLRLVAARIERDGIDALPAYVLVKMNDLVSFYEDEVEPVSAELWR